MSITFVSAGAGSGKTYRLTQIISKAIEAGVSPERILATTFTNKAAEEIRQRVRQKFLEAGDFEKAEAAGAVNIGTVNSVCGSLISDYAFDAGLSPDLKVCDEAEASVIFKKLIGSLIDETAIAELYALEERFGITGTDHNGHRWQDYLHQIADAARTYAIAPEELSLMAGKNARDLLRCVGTPLSDPEKTMADLLESALPEMERLQDLKPQKNTAGFIGSCRDFLAHLRKGTCSWDLWVKLERGGAGRNCADWADKVSEAAAAWRTHPRFHADIRRYLDLIFSTAAELMGAFARIKADAGLVDFTDQEVQLYLLLQQENLRRKIAERLDLLLVDEFQDTSPIQLALFVKLSELAGETYWIGDVKQAIYGFRGSDAALMEGILKEFECRGLRVDTLEKSYRSRPALVRFCNHIFQEAFDGELPPERVVLEPVRTEYPGPALIHWELSGPVAEQNGSLVEGITGLLTSGMQIPDKNTGVMRPLIPDDVAVLCRTNETCEAVRKFCRQARIPLKTSGAGLLATPEASLVLTCLRRLNDREDTLATGEILGLAGGKTPANWIPDRLRYLKKSGSLSGLWRCDGGTAHPLLSLLEELRPLARILGPAALMDTVLVRGGLEEIILAWTPELRRAEARLANLEALRAMALEYEEEAEGSSVSLAGFLLWLEDRRETAEFPASVGDGLTVTTWHSAKGLEWPVVVCHETWKEIRSPVWGSVKVLPSETVSLENPLEGAWIRLWPWPFGALKKADFLELAQEPLIGVLETRAEKEERRLLYVGCTRARDLLVLPYKTAYIPQRAGYTALGETGAGWISQSLSRTNAFVLPDGTEIPYAHNNPGPFNAPLMSRKTEPVHWFYRGAGPAEFLTAVLNPSSQSREDPSAVKTKILRMLDCSPAWQPGPEENSRDMGNLYHGAAAFFLQNPNFAGSHLFPRELKESVLALHSLAEETWPGAGRYTELALTAALETKQIIDARLDLLIESSEGFHIVDHKFTAEPVTDFEAFAQQHGSQLELYRKAVNLKTGKKVIGLWLNLPRNGVLLEIDITGV